MHLMSVKSPGMHSGCRWLSPWWLQQGAGARLLGWGSALPPAHCVTQHKPLNLSVSQLPYLKNEDHKHNYAINLIGLS